MFPLIKLLLYTEIIIILIVISNLLHQPMETNLIQTNSSHTDTHLPLLIINMVPLIITLIPLHLTRIRPLIILHIILMATTLLPLNDKMKILLQRIYFYLTDLNIK